MHFNHRESNLSWPALTRIVCLPGGDDKLWHRPQSVIHGTCCDGKVNRNFTYTPHVPQSVLAYVSCPKAKLEDGKSFPAIENVAAAAVEQGSGIGKRATAGNAVIGDDMGDSELSARPVKSEENATVAADDARDARDPISSADVFSGTAAATSRVTGATVMQDGTRTGKSAMAATTAPAAREVTPQVINVAEAHGGTAGEGSAGYSTRLINTEAITGGAQEGGASTGAAPASAARGGSEFWNKGVKATAVSSVAAAVTPSADARVNQDRGKKVHQGVLLKKRMLSSGWERDVDGGVDTTVGRRGDRVEEEYEEEKRPRKR